MSCKDRIGVTVTATVNMSSVSLEETNSTDRDHEQLLDRETVLQACDYKSRITLVAVDGYILQY